MNARRGKLRRHDPNHRGETMATPQAQDIAAMMRPTKSGGRGGSGKAGRPFGLARKKAAGKGRKTAGVRTAARKGAGGRRKAGARTKKK